MQFQGWKISYGTLVNGKRESEWNGIEMNERVKKDNPACYKKKRSLPVQTDMCSV